MPFQARVEEDHENFTLMGKELEGAKNKKRKAIARLILCLGVILTYPSSPPCATNVIIGSLTHLDIQIDGLILHLLRVYFINNVLFRWSPLQ
jgi:hypothetical protein